MARTFSFALIASLIFTLAASMPVAAQSSGAAKSGTKGTTYGPVLRTQQPTKTPAGPAPVRRAAGEEPVREPLSGGKAPLGSAANPVPMLAQIAPRQPAWYPLPKERQEWTDQILGYWQQSSDKIETFKCTMKRWDYDPTFGPADPTKAYTYGKGVIQYAKPDKGMFKIEELLKYGAPKDPGGEPQWTEQIGEHWVCDGRSIFEYDLRARKLVQRILPVEMQGKTIADGPLPFLFGAKADIIKARYWIQVLDPPEGSKGEYWLEAIPKTRQDAGNFQRVTIVLDEKDFLPKMLNVFAPNYNRKTNPAHTEYSFEKRVTTTKKLIDPKDLMFWKKQFYEPAVPSGWKKVVDDMNAMPEGPLPTKGPAPGTAKKSMGTKTK